MSTTSTTNYKSYTEFEIINISKSMEAKASFELPKTNIMQDDSEESRKVDLLAHVFFPKAPTLTFVDKTQLLSELIDKSYAQEPLAPSVKPSKLSRLVITDAGSTPLMSFMLPVQCDTPTFQPSVNDLGMQDNPLTPPAKPSKFIPEPSYAHLPLISELCDGSSPDDVARDSDENAHKNPDMHPLKPAGKLVREKTFIDSADAVKEYPIESDGLACDPASYRSPPANIPNMESIKPASKLVRQKAFIDLEDALEEYPIESDGLACDPASYRSPLANISNKPPIKPAGKLVRQQKTFADLSDALHEDAIETRTPVSSDLKDAPSELIFRLSDEDEKPVRIVSPYQPNKS